MGSLEKDIKKVIDYFPDLKFKQKREMRFLIGKLDIFDENGSIYFDTFNILIVIPSKYPYDFPLLFELGNKIPKILDRHIFPEAENCCITVPPEIDAILKRGITIYEFINEHAIPHLANQIYYENNPEKKWASGDYAHGNNGIFQYYCEILGLDTFNDLHHELENYLGRKIKKYEMCFCNSDLKFKKCHQIKWQPLSRIPMKRIEKDFRTLSEHLSKLS